MQARRSYGQFCGLARALDRVGDRWTLLIVRELLLGPRRFAELRAALPGIASNLLVDRLTSLTEDGIVTRSDDPPRSPRVTYSLTALGRALEPSVLALIRWGAVWMMSGPGRDFVDERWGLLALRALLEGPAPVAAGKGDVAVTIGENRLTIRVGRRRGVEAGEPTAARARVEGTLPQLLAAAAGLEALTATGARVRGDKFFAATALRG